jgi:hypothetical protein
VKYLCLFLAFFSCASFLKSQDMTESIEQEQVVDESDKIYWNDWYKLEWSDFLGEPPTQDQQIAALSSIGLPYSFQSDGEGVLIVQLNVCFIKSESWSIKDQQNQILLLHEQLHFDIAELHRRKIVKEIMETEFTKKNYEEKLRSIVEKHWIEGYRRIQDLYDKETNYSRYFKGQINWNKAIEKQLKVLEDYTFTELEVSLINFD